MQHGNDCGCPLCMEYGGTRSWEKKVAPMPRDLNDFRTDPRQGDPPLTAHGETRRVIVW